MDVVGLGSCCVDYIAEIDRLPGTNQFTPLYASSWQGGGKVPTALVALGRLGARCGMLSTVGDDMYGRFLLRDFRENGVDMERVVVRKGGETEFCICLAERETLGRSYIGKLGQLKPLSVEELPRDYICGAQFLHLSALDQPSRAAAGWIREAGGRVVLDADRYHPLLEEHLGLIDVCIGSEYFFEGMFPNAAPEKPEDYQAYLSRLRQRGPDIAVITLGEKGCVGLDSTGFFYQPAFSVPVKDTTGAGDVFHGAFIFGMLEGWSSAECARFASTVSAVKCTVLGGRAGIPTRREALDFLETGRIDPASGEKWLRYYSSAIFKGESREGEE